MRFGRSLRSARTSASRLSRSEVRAGDATRLLGLRHRLAERRRYAELLEPLAERRNTPKHSSAVGGRPSDKRVEVFVLEHALKRPNHLVASGKDGLLIRKVQRQHDRVE